MFFFFQEEFPDRSATHDLTSALPSNGRNTEFSIHERILWLLHVNFQIKKKKIDTKEISTLH